MALRNVQGTEASGVADFSNPVKVAGRFNAALPVFSDGQRGDMQLDVNGNLRVRPGVNAAGGSDGLSNAIMGYSVANNTASTNAVPLQAGVVYNGTTWDRQSKATTVARLPSAAATTNATAGKASAGTVYTVEAMNTTAAVKFLKLYNKATVPTVGTDTPFRTIALAPSNARSVVHFPNGLYLNAGISFALTGAAADADTTALAAGDVVGVNIDYS